MHGKKQDWKSCVSLAFICLGVTLSSVTEIEFAPFGFLAALLSTLAGVLQMSFLKSAIKKFPKISVFQLHYNSSVVGSCFILPLALMFEINSLWQKPPSREVWGSYRSMFSMLMLSTLLQYAQSLASTMVLRRMNLVSHQVSGTLKRLTIITASMLYFGTALTASRAFGILFAVGGFFAYSLFTKSEKARKVKTLDDSEISPNEGRRSEKGDASMSNESELTVVRLVVDPHEKIIVVR
jgi:solute carrier family 35 protein E1